MIPSATSSSVSSSSSSPVRVSLREESGVKSDISQERNPIRTPLMNGVWSEGSYKERTVASSRWEPFNQSRSGELKKMMGVIPSQLLHDGMKCRSGVGICRSHPHSRYVRIGSTTVGDSECDRIDPCTGVGIDRIRLMRYIPFSEIPRP